MRICIQQYLMTLNTLFTKVFSMLTHPFIYMYVGKKTYFLIFDYHAPDIFKAVCISITVINNKESPSFVKYDVSKNMCL